MRTTEKNVQLFTFNNSNFRTIIDDKGNPYFVATDVVKILGYSKSTTQVVENHCVKDGVLNRYITDALNREQETIIINEGNLYRLILKSKKPQAKEFESFICDEVLPSIRRTGSYSVDEPKLPTNYLEALKCLVVAEEEKISLLATIEDQKPKVEYCDKVLNSDGSFPVTSIAKELGMTAQKLNAILEEKKIQYKVSGQWVLYKEYQDKGYTKTTTYIDEQNITRHATRWTEAGRMFIHSIFNPLAVVA